jgi:hypothetical protein
VGTGSTNAAFDWDPALPSPDFDPLIENLLDDALAVWD